MNGYLLCIIGTVLICSILTAILPDGKTLGVIKGITRLVCLLAIVAPIPNLMKSWVGIDGCEGKNSSQSKKNLSASVIETDESFIKYYCEMRVSYLEAQLEAEILEKFSTNANVNIDWRFEDEENLDTDKIRIMKIIVELEKGMEKQKGTILEYLTQNYCSEVLIE